MKRYAYVLVAMLAAAGCTTSTQDATQKTLPVKPVVFNTAGAPTVQINAPDMMCPDGCGVKVKEILSEMPGAKEVVVDFDGKMATVAYEEGKFDSNAAVAALVDHGFAHSSLKCEVPPVDSSSAKSPA